MAIHLLTGDDESVLRARAGDLLDELVGDGDRAMMVDEFEGEEYELRAVVDAVQTPPFLTDMRIVVAREVGRFGADDLVGLLRYLEDPLETSHLVMTGGGGRLSTKLTAAVKAAGTVTSTSVGSRKSDREGFVRDQLRDAGVQLDGAATARLVDWVGERPGQLDAVLRAVASAYESGRKLGVGDIEPYLGEAGGLPPWDLTDAIDAGDTRRALGVLDRMLHGGERHPLQVMATLHSHFGTIAKLDGAGANSKSDAEAVTGLKGFRAEKALRNARRLGSDHSRRGLELLAAADLDLRGRTALDEETVMQVLVARLSRL